MEVGDAQGVSSDFNVDFYDPEQTLTATFEAANGKIELDGEIVSENSKTPDNETDESAHGKEKEQDIEEGNSL